MASPAKLMQLPFLRKEQVAKDAYTFYFDRVKRGSVGAEEDFYFRPGQFIRMTLQDVEDDGRGRNRYFSLSSSPTKKEYITITTRIIQSAFKKKLFSLSPGDLVQMFGPGGAFVLDPEDTRPRVFLAGGIGITPFHSMLEFAADTNLAIPLTFFVSFSTVEDVVFYDELTKIALENSNIRVIYTITKPEESTMPWSGEIGRISGDMIRKYVPDVTQRLFMISGPPAMVDGMEQISLDLGVEKEKIKTEKFAGYQ